jgi:AraC-like DNA-binding protein
MLMHRFVPTRPLSDFVHLIWSCERIVRPHRRERILPDGSVELVVDLSVQGTSVLAGARTEHFVLDTSKPITVVGVHFKPGGARPFLPLPIDELQNRLVPLEDVWGGVARELRDRLLAAAAPSDCCGIVERCLLSRVDVTLAPGRLVEHAVERLQCGDSIAVVADAIGLSHRAFLDRFTAAVGLTPKRFARVVRFQKVVHAVAERVPNGWADLAAACGYYDQAHFAHDFRSFSGFTPTEYLERRTSWLNHVPLDA